MRKRQASGKRLIIKGQHILTTEEIYNGIAEEEKKRATKQRKVARKRKVATPEIEEDDTELDTIIEDCIVVAT